MFNKDINVKIDTENLAMPEVHVGSKDEKKVDEVAEEKTKIDFSGAMPEIHVGHKK